MNIDPLAKNDIIARWKNHQSVRRMAKDLHLGRAAIASVIRQHLVQTQSPQPDSAQSDSPSSPPACFGPTRLTRKSKLDPFLDPLRHLLERYPNITAQRAFEELRKLGYSGSYSTLRTYLKHRRAKPKAPVIRFETSPGAQAISLGLANRDALKPKARSSVPSTMPKRISLMPAPSDHWSISARWRVGLVISD